VASLGVGHTHVLLPSGSDPYAFHMYPIRIRWFSDGLAVVSAAREYREAVGGRLTRIGVLNPDIYVPYTLEDYLAGRDPVLDAVLHGRP
jgi:hypothetical protein